MKFYKIDNFYFLIFPYVELFLHRNLFLLILSIINKMSRKLHNWLWHNQDWIKSVFFFRGSFTHDASHMPRVKTKAGKRSIVATDMFMLNGFGVWCHMYEHTTVYTYRKPQAWNNVLKATANINLHRALRALIFIVNNNSINRRINT